MLNKNFVPKRWVNPAFLFVCLLLTSIYIPALPVYFFLTFYFGIKIKAIRADIVEQKFYSEIQLYILCVFVVTSIYITALPVFFFKVFISELKLKQFELKLLNKNFCSETMGEFSFNFYACLLLPVFIYQRCQYFF